MKHSGEKQRAPLLTRPHRNTPLTDEAIERVMHATGLDRDVHPADLRHWLREAALAYSANAQPSLPWKRVIDHAEKIVAAAKKLKHLLENPASQHVLPAGAVISENVADGEPPVRDCDQRGLFLAHTQTRIERLIRRAELGRELLTREMQQRRGRSKAAATRASGHHGAEQQECSAQSDALCVLIGGDLPLIYEVLYGQARKGEAPSLEGQARTRFIKAACVALGLKEPKTDDAIERHRDRYLARPAESVDRDAMMISPPHQGEQYDRAWHRRESARARQRIYAVAG